MAPDVLPIELRAENTRLMEDNASLRVLRDQLQAQIDEAVAAKDAQEIAALRVFAQYDAQLSNARNEIANLRISLSRSKVAEASPKG